MVTLAREMVVTLLATQYGAVRLSRSRLCRRFGISRVAFYRGYSVRTNADYAIVEHGIRHILKAYRRYGYRMIAMVLRKPRSDYRGSIVNAKHVLRAMRSHGLLDKTPRRWRWSKSRPGIVHYENLAAKNGANPRPMNCGVRISRGRGALKPRVRRGRRVGSLLLGWHLHANQSGFCAAGVAHGAGFATSNVAVRRSFRPGSGYMARDYVDLVEDHGGVMSASRGSTPATNVPRERFIKFGVQANLSGTITQI